jgi:uncharacterized protein
MHFGSFHYGVIDFAIAVINRDMQFYDRRTCNGAFNFSIDYVTSLNSINVENQKSPDVEHPIECESPNDQIKVENGFLANVKYLVLGIMFGIVLVKSEIISWYRIQEMFRFHSFHMYGVIGSAVIVGMISVWIIKKFSIKTIQSETVQFHDKKFHKGHVVGGVLFGLGWALTGACPGPLFAQIGSGFVVVMVTLISAIAGTWVYGLLSTRLPH